MMDKELAIPAAGIRSSRSGIADLRSKAAGVAFAAAGCLLSTAAFAQDFDVFNLKPGEVRHVQVWVSNPFVRICNDAESASNVAVGVGRGQPESLQPGMCTTDDVADRFVLRNEGAGQAMVTYRPVNIDGPGGG
jgi:hypothetical protein